MVRDTTNDHRQFNYPNLMVGAFSSLVDQPECILRSLRAHLGMLLQFQALWCVIKS